MASPPDSAASTKTIEYVHKNYMCPGVSHTLAYVGCQYTFAHFAPGTIDTFSISLIATKMITTRINDVCNIYIENRTNWKGLATLKNNDPHCQSENKHKNYLKNADIAINVIIACAAYVFGTSAFSMNLAVTTASNLLIPPLVNLLVSGISSDCKKASQQLLTSIFRHCSFSVATLMIFAPQTQALTLVGLCLIQTIFVLTKELPSINIEDINTNTTVGSILKGLRTNIDRFDSEIELRTRINCNRLVKNIAEAVIINSWASAFVTDPTTLAAIMAINFSLTIVQIIFLTVFPLLNAAGMKYYEVKRITVNTETLEIVKEPSEKTKSA